MDYNFHWRGNRINLTMTCFRVQRLKFAGQQPFVACHPSLQIVVVENTMDKKQCRDQSRLLLILCRIPRLPGWGLELWLHSFCFWGIYIADSEDSNQARIEVVAKFVVLCYFYHRKVVNFILVKKVKVDHVGASGSTLIGSNMVEQARFLMIAGCFVIPV